MKNLVALVFFIVIIVYVARLIGRLNGAAASIMSCNEPGGNKSQGGL